MEECNPAESDTCPVTIPQSVNYYFLPHLNRIIPVLLKMRTTEEGGGQIPRASWGRPDAVKYGKCFPGEFVPESDTCPVTIPQSVNYYFLPHLNRIIPVLLKMRTTEEGGGQIPRASWGRPGKNILPSSMDNNSVLVLCLVVGAMGPVSPIFLIASVSIAGPAFTPPHRFPFNLISAFLGSWFFKLVTQCALQCLVMVRDDAAVYLYVASNRCDELGMLVTTPDYDFGCVFISSVPGISL